MLALKDGTDLRATVKAVIAAAEPLPARRAEWAAKRRLVAALLRDDEAAVREAEADSEAGRRRILGQSLLQLATKYRRQGVLTALLDADGSGLYSIMEIDELAPVVFHVTRRNPSIATNSRDSKGRSALQLATGLCRERMCVRALRPAPCRRLVLRARRPA